MGDSHDQGFRLAGYAAQATSSTLSHTAPTPLKRPTHTHVCEEMCVHLNLDPKPCTPRPQDPEVPRAQLPDEQQVLEARAKADAERQKLISIRHEAPARLGHPASRRTAPGAMVGIELSPSVEAVDPKQPVLNPKHGLAVGFESPEAHLRPVRTAVGPDAEAGPGAGQAGESGLGLGLTGLVGAASAGSGQLDIASSLPFQPISLAFRDLRYEVPNPSYSRRAAKRAATAKKAADAAAAGVAAADGNVGAAAPPQAAPPPDIHAREHLVLLDGITGYAEPRVLTALMGGSGAGKTTLMVSVCMGLLEGVGKCGDLMSVGTQRVGRCDMVWESVNGMRGCAKLRLLVTLMRRYGGLEMTPVVAW